MNSAVPPNVNLSDNRAPEVYTSHITIYALTIIVVALRLIAKRVSNSSFWWDDWFILIAAVFSTGGFVVVILWLKIGLGKHIEVVAAADPTAPIPFLKELLAGELSYTMCLTFTKYSILAFYWRIFGVSRTIRIPIFVLIGIVSAWSVAVVMISCMSCIPIAALWTPTIQGKCIDLVKFYIGNTIPNVLTDIALLLLPLPFVWRLHVATPQKIVVAGAFIIGGLTCVISIVRLAFIVQLDLTDLTWGATNLALYTGLESWCGIICACLPSFRPLLSLLLETPLSSIYGSTKRSTRQSNSNSHNIQSKKHRYATTFENDNGSFKALNDEGIGSMPWAPSASVYAGHGWKPDETVIELDHRSLGVKGINVETEVAWHEG